MLTYPEYEILSCATEDMYGIWEALWTFNSIFPDKSPEERVGLADSVLRRLHADGLIDIYRVDQRHRPGLKMSKARTLSKKELQEAMSRVDERYPDDVILPPDEVHELLNDPDIWEPTGPVYIGFFANKAGFEAYDATPYPHPDGDFRLSEPL